MKRPFDSRSSLSLAIAVSLVVHGVVFWLWPAEDVQRRTPLEIVLLPDVAPPEPEAAPAPPIEPQVAVEAREEPQVEESLVEASEPPAQIAEESEPHPLDLALPESWDDELTGDEVDTLMALPFRPELQTGRLAREIVKKRARILGDRRAEREGLPPDEYNASMYEQGPNVSAANFGNTVGVAHVKTEQGCFNLVTEMGLSGFETSWWRTPCLGASKTVWEQPVLELAPNGQVDVTDL